jgi:hypothetical protein
MLSGTHFYHRITRKMVVSFGTMFNNIRLVRYNKAGTQEIERVTVPLSYASKEKFYTRITQDPVLSKEIQISLPRMSFELNSITYDPLRKISSHINQFGQAADESLRRTRSSPYNFDFTLNIYVRNTEDGTQIIEQILPYFSPDYTLTVDLLNLGNNLKIDIPIILNNISYDVANDTGGPEDTRILIWTLTFTVKGYMFGPVKGDDGKGLIRKAIANTHIIATDDQNRRELNFNTGSGNFKIGELVYEGKTLEAANATAFVESWNQTANQLIVTDSSGIFVTGRKIKGAVSGAAWNLVSTDIYSNQVVYLAVYPDPLTANVGDDFGFTEVYQEYPNITGS